jgi:hypothetical protein
MGNIGDPITPAVPSVGAAGPQYATDIDAILTEVVARLSTKVPLGSISINGDLSLGGNSLTNVANVVFASAGGTPSGSPFNRWASFGGDVYWVSPSGAVQVTTGASLNSAAVGGITGSYGGAFPAQLRYDGVNTRYDLYANFSTNTWAYCRALGFDIPGGATSTAFARLQWGGSSNITLTLPATLPAANQLLSVDNTGAITAGTSTALASGNSITVSGTGVYKHGVKHISRYFYDTNSWLNLSGGTMSSVGSGFLGVSSTSGTNVYQLPPMPDYTRIVNITVIYKNATDRSHYTATLGTAALTDNPGLVFPSTGASFSNTGTSEQVLAGANLTPSNGTAYFIRLVSDATGGTVSGFVIDFDVP